METTLQIIQSHHQLISRPDEGQLSPAPSITIHARVYQMLINGDIPSIINEISTNPNFRFSNLVWELDNSTALHIAAGVGELNLIEFIFNCDQQLFHKQNSEGDLPIHVAVRAGHQLVVERLVELGGSDSIMERENSEKNTALHIALENQHEGMARWLFQRSPQTFYHLNAQGICPLYLAIKAGFWGLVRDMLIFDVRSPRLVEDALRQTRSPVVHAAIMARNQGKVASMISKYPDLLYSFDECGRTACSYAASIGFLDVVRDFLQKFPHEVFQLNRDGSFPIHHACSGGDVDVVKEFLTCFPNTKWLLNKKGQNILHIATGNGKDKVVRYLLGQNGVDKLINMKDKDGNSPLHLATMGKHAKVVYMLTWDDRVMLMLQNKKGLTALDLAEAYKDVPSFEERLTWLALIYANAPRSPQKVNIDQDMTSLNESQPSERTASTPLTRDSRNDLVPKRRKYKDRLNTLLMVSTLISTMTFAAGFTVPGGYNSSDQRTHQEGMATLAHRRAFQVFVLTDTVALYSSIFAAVTLIWAHLDDPKLSLTSLDFALPSLTVALTMMSIAFMTGLFVVLRGACDWLAFVISLLGCAFLPLVLIVFVPLYFPPPSKKNKFGRRIFHVTFAFMLSVCGRRGNVKNVH